MPNIIERLKELEAKSTKDWRYSYNGMFNPPSVCAISTKGNSQLDTERNIYPVCTVTSSDSDARFIAEMRNALPVLLAEREKLLAVVEAVQQTEVNDAWWNRLEGALAALEEA